MTVNIEGQMDGPERAAAEDIKKRFDVVFRQEDNVTIVVGAKCYGEKRKDVDLLIFGKMGKGFKLKPALLPKEISDRSVYLSNFALIIEVKDHSSDSIRFSAGTKVEVRYHGRWSCASDQVFEQVTSVRKYWERVIQIKNPPYINQAIWLRNVPKKDIPSDLQLHVLSSQCTADDILQLLVRQNINKLKNQAGQNSALNYLTLSACRREDTQDILDALRHYTRKLELGVIDRRKLELICQKILKDQQYVEKLGKQLLMFRGRGGAGKTLRLLQIARTLQDELGARVLLLTYNKALVVDIRRLLAILGVSDKFDGRTIHIQSSESYFFGLLKAWDLSPYRRSANEYPIDYPEKKKALLNRLHGFTPPEIAADGISVNHPDIFAWDFVLVDEGQDWPEDERDLLFTVFGAERIIVADGEDQLVRENRCDWTIGTNATNRQIVTLRKSLRLKSNLCKLATAFASRAGLQWDMEPDAEVTGGRVQVILGEYTREVHQDLMIAHEKNGNKPIDALFCLTGASNAPSSNFPMTLRSWGAKIWDGTSPSGRERLPEDVTEHRLVKYESCRGLEGWTVVCLDLDHFYDRQFSEGAKTKRDLLLSPDEAALKFAVRWCLIPFTRAIDTLVLQMDPRSKLAELILPIARDYEDFIKIAR